MSGPPPCEIISIVQVTNVRGAFDRIRALGNLPCITRKLVISDSPYHFFLLHVHDNRLLVREVFQHCFQARLLAQAGVLYAAVAEIGRHDKVLIDLDEAGFEPSAPSRAVFKSRVQIVAASPYSLSLALSIASS